MLCIVFIFSCPHTLQVERLRIAEERLKFEDALKKKDREIQQLKVI